MSNTAPTWADAKLTQALTCTGPERRPGMRCRCREAGMKTTRQWQSGPVSFEGWPALHQGGVCWVQRSQECDRTVVSADQRRLTGPQLQAAKAPMMTRATRLTM